MIRLLIADDEEAIRTGLVNAVNWKLMDVDVVGCASNGPEAYEKICSLNPDVVITDIRMPGMSGLELIEKVKENNKDTLFIILSGYADFEYARQAMRLGVMYYLLKPVGISEIEDLFHDICMNFNGRDFEMNNEIKEKNTVSDNTRRQMEKVFKYIDEHIYDSSLSLKFVSKDVVYMSADYFGRVFKEMTGKYFNQYVMERRIEKAKLLLLDKSLRVAEVADKVGFSCNNTYFGQVFKRYTGMSPKEYRAKY